MHLQDTLVVLPLLFPLAGCHNSSDSAPSEVVASGTIGPEGGSIHVSTGALAGASIMIPPGALAMPVAITCFQDLASLAPGFIDVGPAVRIEPVGLALAVPALLTLPFDPALVPSPTTPTDFVVRLRLADGRVFEALPRQVDQSLGLVTVDALQLATWWVSVPDKVATRDYLPLGQGDNYEYSSGVRLTVSHTRTEPNFLGIPVLKLTFSTPSGFVLGMYLVEDAEGALSLVGSFEIAYDNRQERLDGAALLLAAIERVGARRDLFYSFTGFLPYGGPVPVYLGAANAVVSFVGREPIAAPAGSFEDVVQLVLATERSDSRPNTSASILRLWLAKGVGPVQVQLDEGPLYRLVRGTVGGAAIGN
jgi:hypothetical protein